MTSINDMIDFEVALELLWGILGVLRDKNIKKYNEIKKIYKNLNVNDISNVKKVLNLYSSLMGEIINNEIKIEEIL
jgi:hypothetical protein